MLDRSRLVKNAAVLRFFCARRAERIKYRRFSKSCKVSSTSLWLITLSFTILIAPHQFFYFRETFSGRRERTFFLTGFEKRRYLIFPALRAQKNLSTATFFTERERPDREKVRSLRPSGFPFCSQFIYSCVCPAAHFRIKPDLTSSIQKTLQTSFASVALVSRQPCHRLPAKWFLPGYRKILPISISLINISRINLISHIIQAAVISIGKNGIASSLEFFQIIHHF